MPKPSYASPARELFLSYANFRLPQISSRRFTQAQMLDWLEQLRRDSPFTQLPLGRSAEGRTISLLKVGTGPVSILLWSQMHGDESTATMALMDMLSFFGRSGSETLAKEILEKTTLLMIPMLNPDGAERFQRRTAQLVDMNRDALTLETPEALILKETRETYRPRFGFNLHDQDPHYTVGSSKKVSAVALLAPAYNEERADNDVRGPAKKVAAILADVLFEFIPGHVSKYDDAFEPRAFGDNIQRWGTSTVLIESGGWPGDREKMFLRKLNCVALLTALHAIATGEYKEADAGVYERLPFNTKFLYDIILRNARLKASEQAKEVTVDIGINFEERMHRSNGQTEVVGRVVDVGDLRPYGSFEEIDVRGALFHGNEIRLDQTVEMGRVRSLLDKGS